MSLFCSFVYFLILFCGVCSHSFCSLSPHSVLWCVSTSVLWCLNDLNLFYGVCACPHSVLWCVCVCTCLHPVLWCVSFVSSFCFMVHGVHFCFVVCSFILFCGMWVFLYFVLCKCMLWIEGGIENNVTDFIFDCLYRELSMFMGPRHLDRSSCLRKELWLQRKRKILCLAAKFSSWLVF